jgi:hypothetical protein
MSTQVRNIIIACSCLVVLVCAVVFLPMLLKKTASPNTTSSSSTPVITVYNAATTDVQSVSVTNSSGGFTLNRKSATDWTVVEAKEAPIVATTPPLCVNDVAPIIAAIIIENKTDNIAKYGLDKPTITVKVRYTKEDVTLIFGSQAPDKSGTYFQKVGSDIIYLSSSGSYSYFSSDYRQFIDKSMITIDANSVANIDNITLGGSQRSEFIQLKINPATSSSAASSNPIAQYLSSHIMVKPAECDTNPDNLQKFLGQFTSVSATDVETSDVSATNLKKYGLDNPTYIINFSFSGKNYMLKLGNLDSTGNYPLLYNDVKVIYSISPSSLPYLKWGFTDLASRTILMPNIVTVKTMTLLGAVNEKFDLSEVANSSSGTDTTVTNNGKTVNIDNFKNFYQVIIGAQTEDVATRPQGVASYLTIKYDYLDANKKSDTIEFIPIDSQKYAVALNGVCKFYVLSTHVDKIVSDTAKLMAGQTVNAY